MSETQDSSETQAQTKHSKDVTLVAYLNAPEGTPKEQVMQWFDHSTDYSAVKEKERHSYYIEVDGERESISADAYKLLTGLKFNSLDTIKETETEERELHDEHDFKRAFKRALDFQWPDVLMGEWEKQSWCERWDDGVGNTKVRVNWQGIKSLGKLKHQSEATPEDRWEDEDGVYWAMYQTVEISDVDGETMDELSEQFVDPFMTALARHGWVDTVRLRDCETTETKSGACYDLL